MKTGGVISQPFCSSSVDTRGIHRSHPNSTHIPTSSRLDRLLQQRQINRINRTLGPCAHTKVGHGGQTIDRSLISGGSVGVDDSSQQQKL